MSKDFSKMAEKLGESGESSQYKWFLDNSDSYRCICKRFHVVAMTKALWVYHLLLLIIVTVTFFYHQLIYLWPSWVLVFLSGYAIYRQKAPWMWPFVIWVFLTIIMFVLLGAYLFFYSIFIRRTQKQESIFDSTTSSVLIHLGTLLFCLFHIWQFPIVSAAQRYFKNVEDVAEKVPYGLP
uniref:Uncharacterized protein n=1 Tax=Panagrolaimus sp. PS1159 TaxID=55785 RepID=A0AC35G9F5_9BILA